MPVLSLKQLRRIPAAVSKSFLLKKTPSPAERWLALLALVLSLTLFEQALWWGYGEAYQHPGLRPVSFALPYFIGVLLMGFYQSAFGSSEQRSRFSMPPFWHWLPGIFFLLKNSSFYVLHTGVHVPHFHHHPVFVHHGAEVSIYPMLLHLWGYALWIYLKYFPSLALDKPLFRRHHFLLGAAFLLGALLLGFRQVYVQGWMTPVTHLFFSILTLVAGAAICWLGYLQVRTQSVKTEETAHFKEKYRHSALTKAAAIQLAEHIRQVFEKDQLFADPDLSLDTFAARLGTSRHHVSQAINSAFDLSFSDWVGKRRVEEAILLFEKYPSKDLIIKEIGYRAGFNNKTSFTLAFKKWTGMTPSGFRRKMESERQGKAWTTG